MDGLTKKDMLVVEVFSKSMLHKLATKAREGRGGWGDHSVVSIDELKTMLVKNVDDGDMVDVANLAMMIWWREIADQETATPERVGELHNIWTFE